jgi:hypothetical protein
VDIQPVSNNNIYDDKEDYKDKLCIGLKYNNSKCNDNKTYLYKLSLTIGSSFLCSHCKRSVEQIGWTLQKIKYADDSEAKKQNSNRRYEIKNDDTNISRIKKDKRNSSKTLLNLQ